MLADVLREQGFEVFEAVDAEEAISILKTTYIDAVVTDLHMRTIGDGMAVADYVRAHSPGMSILLASGQAPSVDGQRLPFDAFFVKPFKPEDIAAWIKRRHAIDSPRKDSNFA